MKSIHRSDFFDTETFSKIKNCVFEKIEELGLAYGKEFKRYYRMILLPNEIQEMLLDKAKKETRDDSLEVVYAQIVKYQIKDKEIPELGKHKDIITGEWVMDIVIDATVDWPLVIEDKTFNNTINSVSFIKGEDDWHWRPDFPSDSNEDYVLLLFVHLANKDSDYAKRSKQLFGMGEEKARMFLKVAEPAWGTYRRP